MGHYLSIPKTHQEMVANTDPEYRQFARGRRNKWALDPWNIEKWKSGSCCWKRFRKTQYKPIELDKPNKCGKKYGEHAKRRKTVPRFRWRWARYHNYWSDSELITDLNQIEDSEWTNNDYENLYAA